MSENLNRRKFLGQSVAGGAAVGLSLSSASAAKSANDEIVIGVMGMSRGLSLARSFSGRPGVHVKYLCDVDSQRADRAVKSVTEIAKKAPQAIGDFRKILDDPEIDALVCAAPNHWHAPATILACSAGKNVYVEKPCSHNAREGELMVEAARKNNKAVQMGSQRRSGPQTQAAIAALENNAIGRVYLVRSWYTGARGTIGNGKPVDAPAHLNYDLWQGPAPRVPYVDNRIHYNWHWLWQWGNGELGNNGVHTLDLCRWGLGVDYPIRVTSSGGRYGWIDDQQTPDTHTVSFEFEGRRKITWTGTSCNRHSSGFVTFYGDKGTMELDSNGTHRIYDAGDKLKQTVVGKSQGDIEHIDNFVAAIRDDNPLSLNAEILDGYKSTLLCHLGNIAHRTGRTLNCSAKNGHIMGDEKAMALWGRDYEPGWEPKV
ncbi:MAG: Gfo/Idh/MocA family oxidoreductase [Planctomycetota bacterium]|nr:Gfo/Idh/MocA family oxidoreductase [Planctomycetota bacterium]